MLRRPARVGYTLAAFSLSGLAFYRGLFAVLRDRCGIVALYARVGWHGARRELLARSAGPLLAGASVAAARARVHAPFLALAATHVFCGALATLRASTLDAPVAADDDGGAGPAAAAAPRNPFVDSDDEDDQRPPPRRRRHSSSFDDVLVDLPHAHAEDVLFAAYAIT
ncbi:amidohydrolase [Aureococcus anophagefferens]|nr:amidohydrolase [Aureococcus anophagefferens]